MFRFFSIFFSNYIVRNGLATKIDRDARLLDFRRTNLIHSIIILKLNFLSSDFNSYDLVAVCLVFCCCCSCSFYLCLFFFNYFPLTYRKFYSKMHLKYNKIWFNKLLCFTLLFVLQLKKKDKLEIVKKELKIKKKH